MNPLALFSLLSPRIWWVIAIAAGIGIVYAGHRIDVHNHEVKAEARGRAEVAALWNAEKVQQLQIAIAANATARAEEQRRITEQKEAIHVAEKRAEVAHADAAAAADVAVRLRERIAQLAGAGGGRGTSNPGTAVAGAPACDAAMVLADVLERAEERLRGLAEYADEAAIAGSACERSYEALTSPSAP
jgi:hypothetical protein